MIRQEYINNEIEKLENQIKKKGLKLLAHAGTPMKMEYNPEIESSSELNRDGITTFQELIRILRCAVDTRRVDILTDISMLSGYQASPKE